MKLTRKQLWFLAESCVRGKIEATGYVADARAFFGLLDLGLVRPSFEHGVVVYRPTEAGRAYVRRACGQGTAP